MSASRSSPPATARQARRSASWGRGVAICLPVSPACPAMERHSSVSTQRANDSCSSSIAPPACTSANRWQTACQELLRSVEQLGEQRDFFVIFFDGNSHPMFQPQTSKEMLPANANNIRKLSLWMSGIQLGLNTKPLGSIRKSAGDETGRHLPAVRWRIPRRHGFVSATSEHDRQEGKAGRAPSFTRSDSTPAKAERVLERIARENGGQYRLVQGPWMARRQVTEVDPFDSQKIAFRPDSISEYWSLNPMRQRGNYGERLHLSLFQSKERIRGLERSARHCDRRNQSCCSSRRQRFAHAPQAV